MNREHAKNTGQAALTGSAVQQGAMANCTQGEQQQQYTSMGTVEIAPLMSTLDKQRYRDLITKWLQKAGKTQLDQEAVTGREGERRSGLSHYRTGQRWAKQDVF